MTGMRLLVCGGRDFTDQGAVSTVLNVVHTQRRIALVISGAARGADTLAAHWARVRGVPLREFPADWGAHGRRAGPIRNQQMLDEGMPDGVVAFPGGAGTADMIRRSQAAGLKVWRPLG